jgi:hypothetical protein
VPTPVQLMFQAILDVFEWDAADVTPMAKARIGKVGRELRSVGATPEMVAFSREVLFARFGSEFGPEAIALWWPEVARRWRQRQAAVERRAEQRWEPPPDALPREVNARLTEAMWARLSGELSQEEFEALVEDVIGGGDAEGGEDDTRLESRVAALVGT